MAKITESLSLSIKDKVFGIAKSKVATKENPDALLGIISKNFMAMSAMARDMNVASQNIKELVRVMGGKASDTEDKVAGSGLTADERERKLAVELEKDKPKEEPKKPSLISKLGKKASDKFKSTKVGKKITDKFAEFKKAFNPAKIFKALTKYLVIGAIIGVVFVAFKDAFVEWATGLFDAIKIKFDEFTASIGQWFQDSIQPIIDRAKELIQPIIDAVSSFITKIGNLLGEKIQILAEQFPQTFAFIKNIIDKVFGIIDDLKNTLNKLNPFKKKEKVKPIYDSDETQKLQRQLDADLKRKSEDSERKETERVRQLEKEKQYTGDDEIVRARLGLPPKTETMRRETELAKTPTPVESAPPPAPIVVPGSMPTAAEPKEKTKSKAPSAAPAAKSGAQKSTEEPAEIPGGTPGLVVSALNDAGITSPKAHANVLATVKAESNFKVQSENLNYTSAERIEKVFGAKRIPSEDFAQQFVKNPEALANYVYKTTDGNAAPGDGFKYRGRGFIQHTGKNQYAAISKATGTDLVSNPDALNSPEVAAKAIVWFFLNYKRLKPEDMDNMSKVNKAVAFADPTGEKAKAREASAQQIQASMSSGSGTQMAAASSDVASGQRQQQKPSTPIIVNAPTTNTTVVNKNQAATPPPKTDSARNLAARVA